VSFGWVFGLDLFEDRSVNFLDCLNDLALSMLALFGVVDASKNARRSHKFIMKV